MINLNLKFIQSNTVGNNAIFNLKSAGYGLFEPLPEYPNNPAIWSLLTSEKPEDWENVIGLLNRYENYLEELADSIASSGQLHNIGIEPKTTNGFNVVYGMNRCLAIAYNHARSQGKMPLTVKAEIVQIITPIGRPAWRTFDSFQQKQIDDGRKFLLCRQHGVTIHELCENLAITKHYIYSCLHNLEIASLPEFRKEWFTETVIGIAKTIITQKDYKLLSILADALEEVGCDEKILVFFRSCTSIAKSRYLICALERIMRANHTL